MIYWTVFMCCAPLVLSPLPDGLLPHGQFLLPDLRLLAPILRLVFASHPFIVRPRPVGWKQDLHNMAASAVTGPIPPNIVPCQQPTSQPANQPVQGSQSVWIYPQWIPHWLAGYIYKKGIFPEKRISYRQNAIFIDNFLLGNCPNQRLFMHPDVLVGKLL